MKTTVFALSATVLLTACQMDPNTREQVGTGVAAGAIGAITAQMLGADSGWTAAAALAAGGAGVLARHHEQTNRCAYYTGNGEEVEIRTCGATDI
ncbi:MAG: glucose-6-phosphate isomerase [Qingshengfaniella sp.]